MLFTMQNENRAWHQYCFACKFHDYRFTTGNLTKSRQKQTNKQTNKKPAIIFSFPKKSGGKNQERKKKAGSTIQVFDTFVLETYFVTEVF